MKNIAVYLGIPMTAGGAFQYSLSLIRSLSTSCNIKLIVRDEAVYNYIQQITSLPKCEVLYLPYSKFEFYFEIIYRKLGLPISMYRKLFYKIFSVNRFLSLQRNLCIYPAQDSKAYLVPQHKVIGTVHDLMHLYEYRFKELSSSRIRNTHYQSLIDYCDALLVDSNLGKEQLLENFRIQDSEKVKVLPFCIPAAELTYNASTSLFNSKLCKFIFYPAQFWEHKNHNTLVRAFSLLAHEIPDLKLVLSGAPKNNYIVIKKLVSDLGLEDRVIFCGYIDQNDLSWLYQNCEAFVMASFCGPTNIPPLEALYFGAPIVISDVYAHREQCGDAALYFDPNSSKDLACKLQNILIEETSKSFREKAINRSKHFTYERFGLALSKIINNV